MGWLETQTDDIHTKIDLEDLGKGKRRFNITHTQLDVAPLLQQNAEARGDASKLRRGDTTLIDERPFADVPLVVVLEWKRKFNFDMLAPHHVNGFADKAEQGKFLRKLLNSPEYAYLKTYNGRL